MKKLIFLGIGLFGLMSCSQNKDTASAGEVQKTQQENALKIKGSETVLPISEKSAQIFIKSNPNANLSVTGGGSGVGISALMNKSTDIAQTSRKIKFSEKQKIEKQGQELNEIEIALDALALIVHPSNPVEKLSREQLEGIFTGKIRNWSEVGGEDLEIVPYSRETSSGTYEFFKEIVLKNKNFMSGIMSMPANGALIQSVGQTKGSIAYVGLAYLNQSVKPVSVSFDGSKQFSLPSKETAKSGEYPVVRPLYYYYLAQSEENVRPYIDFILSDQGQKIVEEVGYISIK